ncbi:MAG: class I SAM-dependent methyltransferase [Phycisphaeraceae bacterium]|nr:class I SAM-dependent methyltransferase [Phycisphaeraceae bacterium]
MALNRFDLYTICVQDVAGAARFLAAVHGGSPRDLREDFSGAAGICGAWVALDPAARAIAVDRDPEPLRHAPGNPRITIVRGDVLEVGSKADVIAALNFPIGYWHTRAELMRYLSLSRRRLRPGGVLVVDLYGGAGAFQPGISTRRLRGPSGERILYEWDQEDGDEVTGMVHNAIHFRVTTRGGRTRVFRRAFEYHWRLWSIPELRDAMNEAGFTSVEVHDRLGDAVDSDGRLHVRPMGADDRLDEEWVVYVTGRC